MDLMEAIEVRHSVRQYSDKPLEEEKVQVLQEAIAKANEKSGLHMQLVLNEPKAFNGMLAHYGSFRGVKNYLAIVGKKSSSLSPKAGYYGEEIVLLAQTLGLNSCWVGLTFSKGQSKKHLSINKGKKLVIVIAIGYGLTQGVAHHSKPLEKLSDLKPTSPEWYKKAIQAAALAPTALNEQKFYISLASEKATIKATGKGYPQIDLGIVQYHFDLAKGQN